MHSAPHYPPGSHNISNTFLLFFLVAFLESLLPTSKAAAQAVVLLPAVLAPLHLRNTKPSNSVARMYSGLSRAQCSVLTQLCTAHIGLDAFLYRFHLAASPDRPPLPSLLPHPCIAASDSPSSCVSGPRGSRSAT
ncbi:hypothetical protein B0H17DRAFT_1195615 [Mycena rosella]|uniref:Secreted protein n=1 Tax=Mycena rosella TaxID=1033263 RepID=A0AAD7DWT5_MYCRO|nr:hypothetical protein B0H17DRAFT_1195615 [Mycena rosella]